MVEGGEQKASRFLFEPSGKTKGGARKSFCQEIWRETINIVILQHETLSRDKRNRRKARDSSHRLYEGLW